MLQTARADDVVEVKLPDLNVKVSSEAEIIVKSWRASALVAELGDVWGGMPGKSYWASCVRLRSCVTSFSQIFGNQVFLGSQLARSLRVLALLGGQVKAT